MKKTVRSAIDDYTETKFMLGRNGYIAYAVYRKEGVL